MLLVLSSAEVWSQAELERVAARANHHLAALLCGEVHQVTPNTFTEQVVSAILDACLAEGPRSGLGAEGDLQHDNRRIRCTNIFEPT